MMRTLTIVMAYYENLGMLKEQIRNLNNLSPELQRQIEYIVVDDGSPKNPAYEALSQGQVPSGFAFKLFRMRKDIRWNQDACRNVGVRHASQPWVLLTDMDHMPTQECLASLVYGEYDEQDVYRFGRVSAPDLSPYKPHPNSWFMTQDMYWKAGGYDERFAGYYGTDGDFRDRVQKACRAIVSTKNILIRYPREVIPDASTTTYARREPYDGPEIAKIKAKRNKEKGWKTLIMSQDYDAVFDLGW